MGGRLGYAVRDCELVIVDGEAETVRRIFRRYLECRSVHDPRDDLAVAGLTAKRDTSAAGNMIGDGLLGRDAPLWLFLQNRLYRGEISHKGQVYPGRHQAIVDDELWNGVRAVRADRPVGSDLTQPARRAPA